MLVKQSFYRLLPIVQYHAVSTALFHSYVSALLLTTRSAFNGTAACVATTTTVIYRFPDFDNMAITIMVGLCAMMVIRGHHEVKVAEKMKAKECRCGGNVNGSGSV